MGTPASSAATEDGAAPRRATLWHNPDFARLWIGTTASYFASQVSLLALPLTAVLALAASSAQVGYLSAVIQLPYLLISLFAGVVVDRVRRRNLLVGADLGRAAVLGVVPALYWLHELGLTWLYAVGFVAGCGTVLFDVASQAYLPRLVDRQDLGAGNSMLSVSQSAATIGGPAIGGVLVQWLTAPVSVCASSISYLLSVINIWLIRHREPAAEAPGGGGTAGTLHQVREGLGVVFRNEPLRTMTLMASTFNLCNAAFDVVFVQYMPRTLKMHPAEIGLVFAAVGPGFLFGAVLARKLPGVLGYGRTTFLCAAVANLVMPLIALTRGGGVLTTGILMAILFVFASFGVASNVTVLTIRQSLAPDRLQGRVAATNRFAALGIAPLGALLGGALGVLLGLRLTVLITTLGFSLALIPLSMSSLVRLRSKLPDPISG
ncbi:MAG TPA: MFS transporter [Streptosporangiaceae bacterium]|nr:MFS transporter [Streptosporangiaceae bacterium]